jgi:hypothetical protein
MRIFYAFCLLVLFQSNHVWAQQETQLDSLPYIFTNLQFDSTESTNRFVHPDGLTVRYPYSWERDFRSGAGTLLVYVRKADPKYPQVFRDRVTLRALGYMDSTQNLSTLAESFQANEQSVWNNYSVSYLTDVSQTINIGSQEAIVQRVSLPELSQEKLILIIEHKGRVYSIEYTATDISFRMQLENFWRIVNSLSYLEK